MSSENPVYEFGEFRLDVAEKQLRRASGEVLTIPPKAFELLVFLVENPRHLLEKNELMDKVWADSFVEEGNLKIHIHTLRKVLNENETEFIETIPRRGYRFNADVNRIDNGGLIVEKLTQSRLVIEQTTSDGTAALTGARSWRRIVVVGLGVAVLITVASLVYFGFLRPRTNATAIPANIKPTAIAVLPFKNLTKDGRDEFLSVGLTDALISKLSGVHYLVVRPTSSVLGYALSQDSPQKIGGALKVEALLDGTIQRVDDRLRISLQLISSSDNHVVWAGSFEEQDKDLFKFQDAFSEDITNALQYKISREELAALKRLNTADPEAYRLYLKARYFASQAKTDGLIKAIDLFQQAAKLDDRYALAYTGIGQSYMLLGESTISAILPGDAYDKAIEATRKALEIDPNLPEAYAVLGNTQAKHLWDLRGSEDSYRRAIGLNPNFARAHHLLAWTLIRQGRFEEADNEFRTSTALDPTSLENAIAIGYPAFFAGDYDRAISLFQEGVDFEKNFWGGHMNLWRALHHAGRHEEAWTEVLDAERLYGSELPVIEMAKGRCLALQGKTKEARAVLDKLVKRRTDGEYISPLFLAILCADLSDTDAVFQYLDECIKERNDYMPFMTFAPEFTKYHDDPRFAEIQRRIQSQD